MEIARGSEDFQTGGPIPVDDEGAAPEPRQRARMPTLAASIAPLLGRITEHMDKPGDLSAMLDGVPDEVARMCGTGMAALYRLDGKGEFTLTASAGLPSGLFNARCDETLESYLRGIARACVETVSLSTSYPSPVHEAAASSGIATLVTVPLIYAGEWWGGHFLFYQTRRDYSEEDLRVLDSVAHIIAVNIAHSSLLRTRAWERKAQDQFLDVLSHELRTPLTSILGFTQVLRRRFSAAKEVDKLTIEQLTTVWAQAQRLNRLLDTFMDISSLERGDLEIEQKRLEVTSLLRSSLEQVQAQTRRSHQVELHLPTQPVWIVGDARRLDHIFGHMIANAVRYSPLERAIRVECELDADAGVVVIAVTDYGPGIPEEVQGEIFKRFYPTDARKSGGLGAGLYMSRAIVEAHGGSLTLESSPGAGTTVTIALPL